MLQMPQDGAHDDGGVRSVLAGQDAMLRVRAMPQSFEEAFMTDVQELIAAANTLLNAMETCHSCGGLLALDDVEPAHCENCPGSCDDHDGPDCTPLYVLHRNLRRAVIAWEESR
jgi:hypothetical protein